jgi:hypothetical protein
MAQASGGFIETAGGFVDFPQPTNAEAANRKMVTRVKFAMCFPNSLHKTLRILYSVGLTEVKNREFL